MERQIQVKYESLSANTVHHSTQHLARKEAAMQMKKFYVSFLGMKFLKVKKESENTSFVYFLGLPLFNITKKDNNWKVGILLVYKLRKSIKKRWSCFRSEMAKSYNMYKRREIKQKFRSNKKVVICLMAARPGMFVFDYLYKILIKDKRFEVKIFITPDPFYGIDVQEIYIKDTFNELTIKGYDPVLGYDPITKKYINLRKEINPDIIFYSDFWKPHFREEFYITHFSDKITFLSEYGFSNMQEEKTCTFELNNLVDIYFRPTSIHKAMAEKLMSNKGKNVCVVGAPKLDARFDKNYIPRQIWKQKSSIKKKVIWAPHHSDKMPSNMYQYNAFWEIYDYMLDIASQYKDQVQFVFRPHPVLQTKIIRRWGLERQKDYYNKWNSLSNAQYYGGDVIDLFMTSDAMITDCCSYRAEYTAFDKPLFLTLTKTSRIKNNEFGDMLQEVFYVTKKDLKTEIRQFIDQVVLAGKDTLAEKRHAFVQEYLGKINGKTASENIYDQIVSYLEN